MAQRKEPPGREQAIIALINDLMTATQVEATLTHAGYEVRVVPDQAAVLALLESLPCRLVIADLTAKITSWPAIVEKARAAGAEVIAFGPHVDIAGFAAARAAGCLDVLPRSRFLPDIVSAMARYLPAEGRADR